MCEYAPKILLLWGDYCCHIYFLPQSNSGSPSEINRSISLDEHICQDLHV